MVIPQLKQISVTDERSGNPATLICLEGHERDKLASTEEAPKVLSVDAVLKTVVAILLTVLTGISSWLLVTVVSHSSRIVRNEIMIKNNSTDNKEMIDLLRKISVQQNTMMQTQVRMNTEIQNIKEKINGR